MSVVSQSLPSEAIERHRTVNREYRTRAQSLLMQRQSSDDLTTLEFMDDEHAIQREHAAIHGGCTMGCESSQLIECRPGVVVCNWTREPCERARLALLLDLYSKINRDRQGVAL